MKKSVPEKRQKTFRHAFLRPILIPSCSELTQNKNTIITINEQITKIAQNHPAIVKTSSSEAPCWISR